MTHLQRSQALEKRCEICLKNYQMLQNAAEIKNWKLEFSEVPQGLEIRKLWSILTALLIAEQCHGIWRPDQQIVGLLNPRVGHCASWVRLSKTSPWQLQASA